MPIEDIRNATIDLLNDTSYFGDGVAGSTYHVLEQRPVSIVVSWLRLSNLPETMGPGARRLLWTLMVEVWVKDEGDAELVMTRLHSAIDTINTVIKDNPTLNDTVEMVTELRALRNPGEARASSATTTWLPFNVELDVLEWD